MEKGKKGISNGALPDTVWCWIFMAPAIVLFILFQGWPIIKSFHYSLFDWSGVGENFKYIGFGNYLSVIKDSYFWNALFNNYYFTLLVVPLQMLFGLIFAVLLNERAGKLSNVYRTIYFLPVVTTAAIIGIIMSFLFSYDGPVTVLLSMLGLCKPGTSWLANSGTAMNTTIVIYVWKNTGISMVYWLAGLQMISRDLYEAAKIDGCSEFKSFRYITLPLLVPIGAVITLLNIISSLKLFDLVKTLTDGGPFFKTDVVSVYMYRYAFSSTMGVPRIGYACAAAIVFGVSTILVALLASFITGKIKSAYER